MEHSLRSKFNATIIVSEISLLTIAPHQGFHINNLLNFVCLIQNHNSND